jgi:8-oxo-dGTP diphosphatase
MTGTPRHSVSVAAAILDQSRRHALLIKRRDNGRWEPPGGVLELDEAIEDGLRREVFEETNVEVELGPLTGVYKNMSAGIVALVFVARAISEPEGETEEASSVRWVPITDLDRLMLPAYAIRVQDAVAWHGSAAVVRTHDGENVLPAVRTPE